MSIRYFSCVLTLLVTGLSAAAYGQERVLLKKGNELYEQKKFDEAAAFYQQALTKNPSSVTGMFNLGNAYYKQKKMDAARQAMTTTARHATDSLQRSGASYNIGNTYMDEQKWEDAINAYKQALRNNPQDADARYNLSYAREKLKQQQQNDKNKDKDKKDKQQDQDKKDDQKKQQQDQDKQDQNEQDKPQQSQNKDEDQKEQKQPQPSPSKLSEQQADQILNALQQEEKNLQDKQQQAKGAPARLEKDW